MGMTREGRASSAPSKNNSSMLVAVREKIEKLAPPVISVAPSGKLRPVIEVQSDFSTATLSNCFIHSHGSDLSAEEHRAEPVATPLSGISKTNTERARYKNKFAVRRNHL